MKKLFCTLLILLSVLVLNAQTNYYWNGSTTTGTGTLLGGTGSWTTVTSNTDWLTNNTGTGAYKSWPNSTSYIANFTTGPGTVTMGNYTITCSSTVFTTTGFILQIAGSSQQLSSPIILSGSNINLGIVEGSSSEYYQVGNISATGTNDSIILSGVGLTGTGNASYVVMDGANTSISVPTAIYLGTSASSNLIGYDTKASGVTYSGAINMYGTIGDARAMFGATSGNSAVYSGLIGGTGDIQFSSGATGGAGTLTLTNTGNSFNGNLYMAGATSGKFQVSSGAGACVPSTLGVYYSTASEGGMFDINGSNVTIAALSQTASTAVGSVTNNGTVSGTNILTINQSSTTSFGPLLITDGSTAHTAITKAGTGVLTLTGANTYTGPTRVTGGSLFVNIASGVSASSLDSVFSGGTMGGTGSAGGAIYIAGTMSPGATGAGVVGNFTTGAQTWAAGAAYTVDISALTGTAGTNWDLLTSTGAVTMPASGNVTINVTNTGSGFNNSTLYTWKIITGTSIANFNASNFTINPTGFTGYTGTFSVNKPNAAEIDLVYTPLIPILTANSGSSLTLSGFSTTSGVASASQNFTLAGTNLTGTNIVLTAPTGYELSLNGTTFSSSVTLINGTTASYTLPTLSNTTIYARISATASSGSVSGTITISGGGVTTPPTVTLNGSVVAAAPTIQATLVTFSSVGSTSFTVNWTNGNGAGRVVVVTPTTASSVAPANGSAYTANLNIGSAGTTGISNYVVYSGTGSGPITITGLSAATDYSVEVYEYNGSGTTIGYNSSTATQNPNTQTTTIPTYYWDGATTSGGGSPTGGTGTWNTTTTNWLNAATAGSNVAWPNTSSYAANIGNTPGTITVAGSSATPITANTINVTADGYTMTNTGSASSYLSTSSTSGLTLGNNDTLTWNPNSYDIYYNGNITQAASTTGGDLIMYCNQASSYGVIELQNSTSISVPVAMVNAGAQQFGMVTNGTPANVVLSGGLNLTQQTGAGAFFIGPSSSVTNFLTISGPLTGTGNIVVANGTTSSGAGGKGVLWLNPATSGQNTFSGTFEMEANSTLGYLRACSATGVSGFPTTAGLVWDLAATGGTFDLYGGKVTINSLNQTAATAGGGISNTGSSAATLTVDQSTSTTYGTTAGSLIIADGASQTALTMTGGGTLTLNGANTYTGATTVNGGSLFIDNAAGLSSGSAVTVNAGGILGGSGTAAGTLTINGTVSPGASASPAVGTFTTGAQTWNNGAIYKLDVSNVSGTAGTDWDLLISTGAINVSTGNYTIDLTGNPTGWSPISTYSWTIATGTSIVGFNASNFTIETTNFTATINGNFAIIQSGNSLLITYTPSGLSATPGSFTGMTTVSGVASASVNFSLTGNSLTGAPITLIAPSNFEISLNNSSFSNTITLNSGSGSYSGGTLGSTTIYARITSSSSLGTVSGNITISGGGVSTPITVSLNGLVSVIAPTAQATYVTFSGITTTSLTVNWTNGNGTSRLVVINPTSSVIVPPTSGTSYTANTNIASAGTTGTNNYVVYSGSGSGPITITGLSGATYYYVEVYEFNGAGTYATYLTATATQNPNSAETQAPTYYWNGGTPTAGSGITANGGTGTWTTANAWVEPTNPGTGATWVTNSIAQFGGTPGVVTVPNATITAASSTFTVSGYDLLCGGSSEDLVSNIILSGNNISLGLNENSNSNFYLLGNVTGTGTNDSIILSGTTLSGTGNVSEVVMDQASTSISVPIAFYLGTSASSNLVGFSTKAAGVTYSGNINLIGTVGDCRAMFGATSGNSATYSGLIGGTGDIQYSSGSTGGAGQITLSNTGNNFNGNLYMAGATSGKFQVSAGAGACVPATMGVYYSTASEGGEFDLNGSNVTIAKLSQTASTAVGQIINNGTAAATLTVSQTGSTSFGPLAINNGSAATGLTLAAGTLTLTGANTYTGATNVNGGALYINNAAGLASGSAVTVASGATFGGSGLAAGTLSLSGAISPGATGSGAVSNFTTGAQTWNSGASYILDISALTGTAGTNWDLVTSTGAVNMPLSGTVTINVTSTATGFSNTTAYTWKIITGTSIANFNASNFVVNPTGFTGATGTFALSQPNSTEIDLTYKPALQGSLTANGPFCGTGTGQLTWSASAGVGPYTVVYSDGTANRTVSGVVSGTAFNTYIDPVTNTTTYTLVSVTDNTTGTVRSTGFTAGSATITVNPVANVVITNPSAVCSPSTIDLTAAAVTAGSSTGLTFSYWTNAGGTSALATPAAVSTSGTYYIEGTAIGGCTSIQPVTVTVNITPSATVSNTGPYIPGQTISLTSGPSGASSYSWSGPDLFTASSENVSRTLAVVTMSGTYTVTVTGAGGCSDSASTFVVVNALGDYTWTGATNTSWSTVTNWSPTAPVGGPNGCSQNVIIPVVSRYPVISSAVSIGNVTINSNAQVTLNSSLSICGNLAGGTTAAGIVTGNSHLILNGSGGQDVSGKFTINYFEINNTSLGVVNTATISINNALIMTNGNFNNNSGNITLVSNASGDAYMDNFTSSTAGAFSGALTVQRYISNTAGGYRDLSSPVATSIANLNSAYPVIGQNNVACYYAYSPYPNLQKFDESFLITAANGSFNEHWLSYTALTDPMSPMLGLAFRTDVGSPYTISLTGQPYSGTISAAITNTATVAPANDGWNLLGNPYASPVSWTAIKAINAAVAGGSYYVYNATGDYTGNWGSYNGTTGVNGATNSISSAQGFFIQTSTASGSFTMTNAVRTTASGLYYAPAPVQLDNELRLVLSDAVNSDEIVTYTDANATNDYDAALDAVKMPAGSTVNISYSLGGYDYAINVMQSINEQTVLPLTIEVAETGSYTLNATMLNTPGLSAMLHDALDNTFTDLSAGPVQLSLNGGQQYSGRYSVVFKANTAGINNIATNSTHIYSFGSTVYVQRSSSSVATVSITNVIGQNVANFSTNSSTNAYEMNAVQPWYAIVKVTEGEIVTVAKVLISNN